MTRTRSNVPFLACTLLAVALVAPARAQAAGFLVYDLSAEALGKASAAYRGNFMVDGSFPESTSYLHDLGGGSWLYHSRGTGTWGPPMRLLSPPEVTLIILEPARPL